MRINVHTGFVPRFPQTEILPQLQKHRFNVLVTHRQMGKTVCAVNHLIEMAMDNKLPDGRYFYIAPFLKQSKTLAWDYFKKYLRCLTAVKVPGLDKPLNLLKINEQELSITVNNQFTIRLWGADNPDALRGTYADGVVLDEYGDIKPAVYDEIIRPMLLSRRGWVLFFGTPKGQNQFYDVYCRAAREYADNPGGDWWAGMYRADQTGVIPKEELEKIRRETPDNIFRQEYLCDFTASAENMLISIDDVINAQARYFPERELAGAPKIIGVDVARFGDDKSVIFRRQGLQAYPPIVLSKLDNVDLAGRVGAAVREFRPDAVFVDAGNGAGVIDVLRRMNVDVIEVPFGSAPLKSGQYANKRAEMWGEMSGWVKAGGALPKTEGLAQDLTCATYSFDVGGKMKLESKEKIKERLGKSPDLADALALTFAAPVQAKNEFGCAMPESYNTDYDFLS